MRGDSMRYFKTYIILLVIIVCAGLSGCVDKTDANRKELDEKNNNITNNTVHIHNVAIMS
jgi:hypothetical protein